MKEEITTKWPAVRIIGKSVSVKKALDFIWKTDYALQNPKHACNDREFCDELEKWLGFTTYESKDYRSLYKKRNNIIRHRGQLYELEHFSSHWVASSYINGPHGLVSPQGEISLCRNFGKWPTIGQIENELIILTNNFSWLSFTMGLWDPSYDEDELDIVESGQAPNFMWKVNKGKFERIINPSLKYFNGKPLPRIDWNYLNRRETTWSMEEIRRMWGNRL